MTEEELQGEVTAACDARGIIWIHAPDPRRVRPGWVDLVLIGRAYAVFAELKSEDGRRSLPQIRMAAAIVRAGLHYRLWEPQQWRNGKITAELDAMAGRFPARV